MYAGGDPPAVALISCPIKYHLDDEMSSIQGNLKIKTP
jgi:hypothetical protein